MDIVSPAERRFGLPSQKSAGNPVAHGRLTDSFVYLQEQAGKDSLMMVKTSGNAAPVVLREGSAELSSGLVAGRRLDHPS